VAEEPFSGPLKNVRFQYFLGDEIRNKIGSNSEKGFNNPRFLNGSEVENKPSTPLFFEKDSSRFTKAGVSFSFPFFLSPFGRCEP
jgi:hypothetical protein